ncbi:MAG: hypothetical protein JW891_12085 [Candidatus Lokiarchaeota archaeon]|nr:hypothetical protein [Candidatus Lokiarchaeota archaeon]
MGESEFIKISNVFTSLDIIEKGIEKIYYYLLKHNKIENLKEVCEQFDLTLKRGYKICSVLSDLELVQIYDRPMKVLIATPIASIWQKIMNHKIEELRTQFQEKRNICEASLQDFLKSYNLLEEEPQEPVEFINFESGQFEQINYAFYSKSSSKLAVCIKYNNPLVSSIQEAIKSKKSTVKADVLPNDLRSTIVQGVERMKKHLKIIDVKVIFNSELLDSLVKSKEFEVMCDVLKGVQLEFNKFSVKVVDDDFSNFCLMGDNELVQPSFSPTHELIGIYISRNKNIFQIFNDKFNELFFKATPLTEYIEKNDLLEGLAITELQSFILCLL